MLKVELSSLAEAGIRKLINEESWGTAFAHLRWYLRTDPERFSVACEAFPDRPLYIYPFDRWRVLYERRPDAIIVWSFLLASEDEDA